MKTAMQEAIKEIAELWSSPSDRPNYTQIFKVLESKLEKEKEQIIQAVEDTRGNIVPRYFLKENLNGEQYYNQTYNKNK